MSEIEEKENRKISAIPANVTIEKTETVSTAEETKRMLEKKIVFQRTKKPFELVEEFKQNLLKTQAKINSIIETLEEVTFGKENQTLQDIYPNVTFSPLPYQINCPSCEELYYWYVPLMQAKTSLGVFYACPFCGKGYIYVGVYAQLKQVFPGFNITIFRNWKTVDKYNRALTNVQSALQGISVFLAIIGESEPDSLSKLIHGVPVETTIVERSGQEETSQAQATKTIIKYSDPIPFDLLRFGTWADKYNQITATLQRISEELEKRKFELEEFGWDYRVCEYFESEFREETKRLITDIKGIADSMVMLFEWLIAQSSLEIWKAQSGGGLGSFPVLKKRKAEKEVKKTGVF